MTAKYWCGTVKLYCRPFTARGYNKSEMLSEIQNATQCGLFFSRDSEFWYYIVDSSKINKLLRSPKNILIISVLLFLWLYNINPEESTIVWNMYLNNNKSLHVVHQICQLQTL